jgi:hypothetical protein
LPGAEVVESVEMLGMLFPLTALEPAQVLHPEEGLAYVVEPQDPDAHEPEAHEEQDEPTALKFDPKQPKLELHDEHGLAQEVHGL